MITIVIPYKDRQHQLTNTLLSIKSKIDFNVIIINDDSPDILLPKVDYHIEVIKLKDKQWNNPDPVYNTGLLAAKKYDPDIIILQNPECYHEGDILTHAKENCTNDNYLSYGCYSLNKGSNTDVITNNIGASRDGQEAWYNHSIYRPVGYEFCAAITYENIVKLNGYDERMMYGWGYGDTYLQHRIKLLGLKIKIIDSPFVFHQWHYGAKADYNNSLNINKNKEMIEILKAENSHKARHIITNDL